MVHAEREPLKRPHDIDAMFRRIRKAVAPFPKAALFELAEQGHGTVFEQLVACIISIRTLDEVTLSASKRLFERARTPAELARLSVQEIDTLIRPCTFHYGKAGQIRDIAIRVEKELGGSIPCDQETLLSFHGVGLKCANLVLGVACRKPFISVDVHVHRVTNRWGYVSTHAPEKTALALAGKLPRRHWIEINRLLVPFGKRICTGSRPKCSECPVLEMCQQVGVTSRR